MLASLAAAAAVYTAMTLLPVSYTHLDVYKRQVESGVGNAVSGVGDAISGIVKGGENSSSAPAANSASR